MAIRLSGELPIQEIANEFGGGVAPNPLSDYYGNGIFLSSGYYPNPPAIPSSGNPLNVGAFYGKSKRKPISLTITANEANVDVFNKFKSLVASEPTTLDLDITLTINSGVTVYSTLGSTIPALTVKGNASPTNRLNGFLPTDSITIINNGNIVGAPTSGTEGGLGNAFAALPTTPPSAISVVRGIILKNNGIIASGGIGGRGGRGGVITGPTVNCSANYASCAGCTSRDDTAYGTCYTDRAQCTGARDCWVDALGKWSTPSDQGCGACKVGPWELNVCTDRLVRECNERRPPQCRYRTVQQCNSVTRYYDGWLVRTGVDRQAYSCAQGYTRVYSGTCKTPDTNVKGGTGGNGADWTSNVIKTGGLPIDPATGTTATHYGDLYVATKGNNGGMWGSGVVISGVNNILNGYSDIGGNILGTVS